MPGPPSSQGSTVSWAGSAFSRLLSLRYSYGSAQFTDATYVACQVVGEAYNSRVVKRVDCIGIEPGTVEITMYGSPSLNSNNIGDRNQLVVTVAGSTITFWAYLETFDVTAQVGEFVKTNATFRLTGE